MNWKNMLFGVGCVIIGIPLALLPLVFAALAGWNVVSTVVLLVVYGIIGYILGKIRPGLGWKSGLLVFLGSLLVVILLALGKRIIDLQDGSAAVIFLILIISGIISALGSHLGSRSQKAWEGRAMNIFFAIVVSLIAIGIIKFVVGGVRASHEPFPVTPPALPSAPNFN